MKSVTSIWIILERWVIASIELKRLNTKVGATSTVIGAALLQAIMVQSAQNLLNRGIKPELSFLAPMRMKVRN